jgi:hypothetical protein
MKQVRNFENLLVNVLSQQSESKKTKEFRKWLTAYIKRYFPDAEYMLDNGNLYVTKGKAEIYPCMVSHIDTVHNINRNVEVFKTGDNLFAFDTKKMRQYGIGGDDKVGVFICLMMLHELPAVKCAFFRDEEIGCVGSALAVRDWFVDCAFALQCDRRGYNDFIEEISGMEMYGEEFRAAIKEPLATHGYKQTYGMMTDVEKLKRLGIDICMANMSCGYYEPHTNNEYVNVPDVMNCFLMCKNICITLSDRQWKHVPPKPKYTGFRGAWYDGGDDYGWDSSWGYDYLKGKKNVEPYSASGTRSTTYNGDRVIKAFNDGSEWMFTKADGWKMTKAPSIQKVPMQMSFPSAIQKHTPIIIVCPMCNSAADLMFDSHENDNYCSTCGDYVKNLARAADAFRNDTENSQLNF